MIFLKDGESLILLFDFSCCESADDVLEFPFVDPNGDDCWLFFFGPLYCLLIELVDSTLKSVSRGFFTGVPAISSSSDVDSVKSISCATGLLFEI